MSEIEDRIAKSFAAQGLMATLGADLVHVEAGEVHIAFAPRPEIAQQHGYVHAGAVTSALDSACGYAALSVAPADTEVLSVEFKVNLMRPAVADRFVAVGKVIKPGRTLTVCQGELLGEKDGERKSIAIMQATMISVPSY